MNPTKKLMIIDCLERAEVSRYYKSTVEDHWLCQAARWMVEAYHGE